MHAVKSLLKVYKVDVELSLPLCALLYDVTQDEDLVCASLSFPKPCLLSSQLLVHCTYYSLEVDLRQVPFFGIFTMTPSVQSSGDFFPSQMSVKSG